MAHTHPVTTPFDWVGSIRLRSDWLQSIADGLKTWSERAAARRELVSLDARMLRDIGITRDQAMAESLKPFWQD